MLEFQQDGQEYRVGKLNAIQQFNIGRRVGPLIPRLFPIFLQLAKDKNKGGSLLNSMESMSELLQPFADGLAAMKDEDAEYVFNNCLSVIRRKTTQTDWVPIWVASSKMSMFEDLNDLSKMIPLVIRVITDSLGPFMRGLLISQEQPAATT